MLEECLGVFGKDLTDARVNEYRKLYHEGWKRILEELVPPGDRQWLTDKYRTLVF
ncbi:MAG: hypothetical protein HY303_15660 [Candidatus Wallbacteria bacterium]|nr:hypothetical protein [Candidatus Wallbacteria bacterium]